MCETVAAHQPPLSFHTAHGAQIEVTGSISSLDVTSVNNNEPESRPDQNTNLSVEKLKWSNGTFCAGVLVIFVIETFSFVVVNTFEVLSLTLISDS